MLQILTIGCASAASLVALAVAESAMRQAAPYSTRDRVVWIGVTDAQGGERGVALPAIERWSHVAALEQVAAYTERSLTIRVSGEPALASGALVSAGYFNVLGVRPLRGRLFGEQDDRPSAEPVVVVSREEIERLGLSLESAVGSLVSIGQKSARIVGIVASGVSHPSRRTSLWMPITPALHDLASLDNVELGWGIGLLRAGASPGQLEEELRALEQRDSDDHSRDERKIYVDTIISHETASVLPRIRALLGAAVLMLVLALATMGNARVTRSLREAPEMRTRLALGASMRSLVFAALSESAAVSVVGVAGGCALAAFVLSLARVLSASAVPEVAATSLSTNSALTGLGILCSNIIVSTGMSLFMLRRERDATRNLNIGASRLGSRAGTNLRKGLVAFQVALTLVLLVGAGVLLKSYANASGKGMGFRTQGMFAVRVSRPILVVTPENVASVRAFADAVSSALHEKRQFEISAISTSTPGASTSLATLVSNAFVPAGIQAYVQSVSPDFFRSLDIPIRSGRPIQTIDREQTERVAVISESMARSAFGSTHVLGRILDLPQMDLHLRIVGIAGDTRQDGVVAPVTREIYVPFEQLTLPWFSLIVRSRFAAPQVMQGIRDAIHRADPNQSVDELISLEEFVKDPLDRYTFYAFSVSAFAVIALFLTFVGLHGVVALHVEQRRREMGICMSLGATPAKLFRSIVWDGVATALVGVVFGLILSIWITHTLQSLLFGISPNDPTTTVLAALSLVLLAAASVAQPAWRATRAHPADVLKCD